MLKRLLLVAAAVLLVPLTASAQWTFEGIFPQDTLAVNSGHGIAVDPDGKVWFQPFSATDSVQVPDLGNEYRATRVIYVYNADGTPASFSPLKFVDLPGGERDTLGGLVELDANGDKVWEGKSGRGLRADSDGNIIVSQWRYLYKINYQTGAGMAKNIFDDYCSLSAPATDGLGNVYVAPVCPGPPIRALDGDLQLIDNAVDVTHGFSRSFEVSADGNTIYWAGYTNHAVLMYQRPDEFSSYDSLGVVLQGFDSESLSMNPVTGNLWASAGSPNDLPNRYPDVTTNWKPQTWYEFSLDSLVPNEAPPAPLNLFAWQNSADWADGRPRGLAFSPDGEMAYVTQFNQIAPSIQVFKSAPFVGPVSRKVTLTLNTATLPDTTWMSSLIEVRGAVGGEGGITLPDGNVIDWNEASTIEPTNVGGDYWETSFEIPTNAEMQFKFYSQQAEDGQIGGWEDGDNHVIAAGTDDVTMPLHYFVKGDGQPYDWRPFESAADSVGVWFRVYMNTEDAITKGYDRDAEMTIGLRGDDFGQTGALDWGTTKVTLTREGDDNTKPGYDLYSGLAMYPASLVGSVQNYKYFIEPDGWEADQPVTNNRQFTIPAQDTTLHWVHFSNSTPVSGDGPSTAFVIFTVDTTPLEDIGLFDRARGDTLEVRGGFNGWSNSNPDNSLLFRVPGSNTFENAIALTAVPGSEQAYKFFINFNDENFRTAFGQDPPNGWEEPISKTGANRTFAFEGNASADQDLGVQFFNDVLPGNIIPEGNSVDVTFSVNMAPAVDNPAQPFVPGTDSVHVDLRGDALWGFTQGFDANATRSIFLEDTDGDMVYTGTFTVNGPTYGAIQYKYGYGLTGAVVDEQGGGFNDVGRRRTRFIAANADGSWPSAWSFPAEEFLVEGLLPSEPNPADPDAGGVSVEELDGELPTTMTLSQNYPNPFNPVTTIEYSLNQTMDVKLQVFNVLGQVVTTLVDGVQQASTYRVSFEAADLASGIYIYQLETTVGTLTKQMILMK